MLPKKIATLVAVAIASSLAIVGCSGSKSLTLSSTCADYLKLSTEQRHTAANQLGVDNHWVGAGNPLYLTNLDYTCGQSPNITLKSAMGIS